MKQVPKITRKHSNTKQSLRNGIATNEQAKNYNLFKKALHALCDASNHPPFYNTTILELKSQHGIGYALREAVQE